MAQRSTNLYTVCYPTNACFGAAVEAIAVGRRLGGFRVEFAAAWLVTAG